MAAPTLTYTDMNDQALLRLSGLPKFNGGADIAAALPQDGAQIRLVVSAQPMPQLDFKGCFAEGFACGWQVAGVCYLEGTLFEPVDPERSVDLNGMLTQTGEWTGLTWSLRKRVLKKWPRSQLLSSGTAINAALLPSPAAAAATEPATTPPRSTLGNIAAVESPQRGALSSLDSQMGSLAALLADCKTPPLAAPGSLAIQRPSSPDPTPNHRGQFQNNLDDTETADGGSELVQGLRSTSIDSRLETMGSIAAMLEIMATPLRNPHHNMILRDGRGAVNTCRRLIDPRDWSHLLNGWIVC